MRARCCACVVACGQPRRACVLWHEACVGCEAASRAQRGAVRARGACRSPPSVQLRRPHLMDATALAAPGSG